MKVKSLEPSSNYSCALCAVQRPQLTDLKYIEMNRKYTEMHHIYLFIFFSDPLSMNIKFKDSCAG